MRPTGAPTDVSRSVRPTGAVPDLLPTVVSEAAFHRLKATATALTNTHAGETFATPDAVYARINNSHFRVATPSLSHTDILSLIGRACRREGRHL